MQPKRGLGKGISAIIPINEDLANETVSEIDINKIEPNPDQPRKDFDKDSLRELSESIGIYGVLQPLIVSQHDGFFTIIAGERRWRAARMAGLQKVPVVIKKYAVHETLMVSLIENLQRSDLNIMEEAVSFKRLSDEFGMTQERISEHVGKSRSHIANAVRLLDLDERVQQLITDKTLSFGHAKLLAPLKSKDKQFAAAENIIDADLTVRDTELLVKQLVESEKADSAANQTKQTKPAPNPRPYHSLETELNTLFGTNVRIINKNNRGKIEIEYFTENDLNRLIELIKSKMI
jgi:ParB family chromosome partitioning protein